MTVRSRIYVHPLFWVVAMTAVATGYFRQLLIVVTVVLIHEAGHAFAALFFKWRLERIELFPFGGVIHTNAYGNAPFYQEVIVAIAGPLQHIWLLFIPFSLLNILPGFTVELYFFWLGCNASLLCFNLLPIHPLDGGRLLYAVLSLFQNYSRATKRYVILSSFFCIIAVSTAVLVKVSSLHMWLMALFLIYTHLDLWKKRPYAFMQFLIERAGKQDPSLYRVNQKTVAVHTPLSEACCEIHRGIKTCFYVEVDSRNIPLWDHQVAKAYMSTDGNKRVIGDLLHPPTETRYNTQ
ncbi:stage IV sporulation protein FB [Bacillaceae bacterium SIJ1]|uniref:M50 family metallopeptidase n=1 Tax=Litoribacterium kuwaitense TaxID=1398745 RepID=UPI0013EBA4AF|nr:M50 family metallopeptidase [Litoribacterium kuwaitense]NGP45483.1 stage IV sporulation protein FB [Litoribacterium kuwaitense]